MWQLLMPLELLKAHRLYHLATEFDMMQIPFADESFDRAFAGQMLCSCATSLGRRGHFLIIVTGRMSSKKKLSYFSPMICAPH